jgi:ketosteroid isomerase-like protein
MAHEHQSLMDSYLGAAERGDFEGMADDCTPDVVLHIYGRNPTAGTFHGRQEFIDHLNKGQDLMDLWVIDNIEDLLYSENHAIGLILERMERGGKSFSWVRVNIYRIVDGKIAEIWCHEGDQYAFDAFFADTA